MSDGGRRTPAIWSTHESIALLERWLPRELIDSSALARIEQFSRRLPCLFSSYYLECRLEQDVSRVDLLASLAAATHHDGGEREFASLVESKASPAWRSVGRFSKAWLEPATPLRERIPLVWLEFDDVLGSPEPAPCFHVCVERGYMSREGGAAAQTEGCGHHRELLATTFEALLGHPLPTAVSQALHVCFERALSVAGRIIHVSAMLTRTPATLKLYGCIPARSLSSYLRDIGWPGSIDELNRLLGEFCSPSTIDQMLYIDLAFEERLTPFIGIVFSQPQLSTPTNADPRRAALLERLVGAGLCTPPKRDALMQWPGSARVRFPGSSEPARMRRWMDVKVSYYPDRAVGAKVYLGFMPVFSLF